MPTKEELLELADLFIENEKLLGSLYELCEGSSPSQKESWESLRKAEEEHARIFGETREAIASGSGNWSQGKFFPQALKISVQNSMRWIADFRQGKATRRGLLNFLLDCEQSLLEIDLTKSFQTDRKDLADKLASMQSETLGHRNLLRTIISKEG